MAAPQLPPPVKLFVAALWTDPNRLADAALMLERVLGPIDFVGPDRPFDVSDYYDREMGGRPQRRLLAFAPLAPPDCIREGKLTCNHIENLLSCGGRRKVNLDLGFLDDNKLVLASAKEAGQKIYLGDGIYADLVARYKAGRFQPFEWTFPDFRDGRYDEELAAIRKVYLQQLRSNTH